MKRCFIIFPLLVLFIFTISCKQVNQQAEITSTSYEGKPHLKVQSGKISWYYDMEGGGFSRIIDEFGNDWVSFRRNPWNQYPASAASAYRGLPNLVFKGDDGGAGHPGHDKCRSRVERDKIITESKR